jgi:uncharacterized protein YbjT (DUF2867 family)
MTIKPTLVLGGTGKTGRRAVERHSAHGIPVRVGSRSGEPRFDWDDRSTWATALKGMGSVYVSHYLDALPGAAETVGSFADLAVRSAVDFADYARDAAAAGVWNAAPVSA